MNSLKNPPKKPIDLDKIIGLLLNKYPNIFEKESGKDLSIEEIVASVANYYESIIASMPGNVYWLDKNCCAVGCNMNVLKMFGLKSQAEFKGLTFEEMGKIGNWPSNATLSFKKDTAEVIKTGKAKLNVEEPPIPHADGRIIYFLTSRVPLFDYKGDVIGVVGISIDVTDRKRVEKLQIEKKAALKSLEMIELLSASIAFEMRSAMAVIGINADLLNLALEAAERDLNSAEEHKNIKTIYEHIKYAIHNSETIVNMLLTKVNNVIAGKIDSKDFEFQSIKNVIISSIDEYPFLEKEKKLVHWDPKANKDFKYFGREGLTKNVLFNLIKKALRAIKEYDKGEIFITLASDENFNYLVFKDTGMGIPESHMAKLFQQFNTHTSGGSGLGLAFCKMVMTSFGGDITCKSKEREFTEFTLSFPKDGGTNTTLKQKITARQAK